MIEDTRQEIPLGNQLCRSNGSLLGETVAIDKIKTCVGMSGFVSLEHGSVTVTRSTVFGGHGKVGRRASGVGIFGTDMCLNNLYEPTTT